MVGLEGAVELQLQQLRPDGLDVVVGENETVEVQIVLSGHVQHLQTVLAQPVVAQVQDRGLGGEGGEPGEAGAGAVDDDGVGDVAPPHEAPGEKFEVVEVTAAAWLAVGGDMTGVVLHHSQQWRLLGGRGEGDGAGGGGG